MFQFEITLMIQRNKMTSLNMMDGVNDFISVNGKAVDNVLFKLFDAMCNYESPSQNQFDSVCDCVSEGSHCCFYVHAWKGCADARSGVFQNSFLFASISARAACRSSALCVCVFRESVRALCNSLGTSRLKRSSESTSWERALPMNECDRKHARPPPRFVV